MKLLGDAPVVPVVGEQIFYRPSEVGFCKEKPMDRVVGTPFFLCVVWLLFSEKMIWLFVCFLGVLFVAVFLLFVCFCLFAGFWKGRDRSSLSGAMPKT